MKKFLSLVLALVMAMSLVTVSAGAKDFNDGDKISGIAYEEAVNVMSEMGIIDGYGDGNFQPQGTLTRGAAAKIIACMMLGKTTAEALGTQAAPFKDVPVGSTFAGYIAYCSESGIIDGYSDGTFRPGNSLTGFAFLKMLLTALGYDSAIEGYANNPNWTVNVAGRAKQIGLLDGNDAFVGTRAATREEACLYAVNALQATLVEYNDKGGSISVGDITINTGASNATYVTSNVYDQATSIDSTTDNGTIWTVEFAEKYQPDLRLKGTTDAFGRPAHIWTWKNNEVGTYVDYDKMVAEYTTKVTGRDLYDLLGKAALDECDVYTYVDGETTRDVLGSAYFTENNIVRDNTEKVGATGDGVLTQVFHDTRNDEITISVINTYLAKAEEDYDDKNEDVELRVYAIDNVGGRTAAYVKDTDEFELMTVEAEDFDIEDVVKDQLILVTVADGEIQTMAAPEILSEVSISKFSSGKYVISGGTQYDYASTAMYDPDVLDDYTGELGNAVVNLKDLSYNIILDPYGYMIGVELNEDPAQYLFLTGLNLGSSNLGASNADANVIFTDGKMDTVTVNMRKSEAQNGDPLSTYKVNGGYSQLNTWCTYTVNSDGVYTLKQVDTDGNAKSMQSSTDIGSIQVGGDWEKDSITIDKKHVSLDGIAGQYNKVYGDDESIYINVELDDITDKTNAHVWIVDDVESVTTGIANVSVLVKELGDVNVGTGVVDDTVDGYEMPEAEIYTLFDDEGYVIAAITIGENQGTTTNFAYITSDRVMSEEYKGDSDLWVFTREAIVNGKIVDLTEVGDSVDVLDDLDQGDWYKIKYDADGYVRGYEVIEGKLTNADPEDGYIDNALDFETAVDAKDLVLLDQDLTAGYNYLSFRNGSLYVTTAQKTGFYVSPNVQVTLSLASEPGAGANLGNAFDDIDDSYTGRTGLEKALRNLDTDARDIDGDGAVEYPFKGMLSAVIENGVATSIVLDDRSGTLGVDYNPLVDMTVTVKLVDIDTDRALGTDTVTVTGAHAVSSKLGVAIAYPTVNAADYAAYLNTRWGVNYQPVPAGDSADLTYVEGKEYEVTFYYRETVAPVTSMNVLVSYKLAGGTQIGSNQFIQGVQLVDGQKYAVLNDGGVNEAKLQVPANYELVSADPVAYSDSIANATVIVARKTVEVEVPTGLQISWDAVDGIAAGANETGTVDVPQGVQVTVTPTAGTGTYDKDGNSATSWTLTSDEDGVEFPEATEYGYYQVTIAIDGGWSNVSIGSEKYGYVKGDGEFVVTISKSDNFGSEHTDKSINNTVSPSSATATVTGSNAAGEADATVTVIMADVTEDVTVTLTGWGA